MCDSPCHQDVVIAFAPFNIEVSAIQHDFNLALAEAFAHSSNSNGAGPRTAGLRFTGSAFPDTHAEFVGAFYLYEFDVGLLRKQRVGFQRGAELLQIKAFDIVRKDDSMRIADIDTNGLHLPVRELDV